MRFAPLALVIAAIVGNAAFAEDSPLPVEVVNPTKLTTAAPENPVVTVGGIVANSMASDAPAPLPVNFLHTLFNLFYHFSQIFAIARNENGEYFILFPNENAPRCSANFSLWLTGVKCSVAALR